MKGRVDEACKGKGETLHRAKLAGNSNTTLVEHQFVHSQSSQKCQTEPQLEHVASVTFSFLESPVARTENPSVSIAPTAFPPLMPFLSFTRRVVTDPFVWQCGQTICALCLAWMLTLPD